MRMPCQRLGRAKNTAIARFIRTARACGMPLQAGTFGWNGKILPGFLPAINHTGAGFRSLGGQSPSGEEHPTMRVLGPNGTALAMTPSTIRRAGSGTFTVSEEEAPHGTTAASNLRAIS